MTETGLTKVQISYEGAVAQMNTKALTSAAVAGLLRPMLQDVNVVSAPVVAKERGIVVEETTREMAGDYESLITVTVTTRAPVALMSPAPCLPTAARASSISRASAWTPNSGRR